MTTYPLTTRHTRLTVTTLVVMSAIVGRQAACGEGEAVDTPLDVGSSLELAVDPRWIDSIDGARLERKTPVPREVVMQGLGEFGYLSVLKDGDVYRMYHRTVRPGNDPDGHEFFCYLESRDGIRWSKPNLDLFTIPGLDARNAITEENMAEPGDDDPDHFPCISHNLRPFLDTRPDVPESEGVTRLPPGGVSIFSGI